APRDRVVSGGQAETFRLVSGLATAPAATNFRSTCADHLLPVQAGTCLERSRDRRLAPEGEVGRLPVPEPSPHPLGPVVRRLPDRLPQELAEPLKARLVHLLLDAPQRRHGVVVGVGAPLLPAAPRLVAVATAAVRIAPDGIPVGQEGPRHPQVGPEWAR